MAYQVKFIDIAESNNYLHLAAAKAIELCSWDFSSTEVILPNYSSCEAFKSELLSIYIEKNSEKKAILLPKITTAKQFISMSQLGQSNVNNENYILVLKMAFIAYEYLSPDYKICECLKIAPEILDIFWELKLKNISLDQISSWLDQDIAFHWWEMAKFLDFCFSKFDKQISDFKIDLRLQGKKDNYIIIGSLDSVDEYTRLLNEESNIYFFLPPLISLEQKFTAGMKEKICSIYSKLSSPAAFKANAIVSKPISINYISFKDILDEAAFIAGYIRENTGKKICIITENRFLKDILSAEFEKDGRSFNSSFGKKFIDFEESNLFIRLAKFKCNNGDFASFIDIITSPIISSTQPAIELKNQLNSIEKYLSDFKEIPDELANENKKFFDILNNWLEFKSDDLQVILTKNYDIFVELYKLFECESDIRNADKFMNLIYESIDTAQSIVISTQEYLEFVASILSMKYSLPMDRNALTYVLNYEDALLIDADIIIFADFNEDSVLTNNSAESIWLSSSILKKLGILSKNERFNLVSYIVSSKINGKNALVTRSETSNGIYQQVCPIINYIKGLEEIFRGNENYRREDIKNNIFIESKEMPSELYPTNIELLMRDSYGFYSKKILGLRPKFNMLSKVDNSDFGIITHELIEQITNNKDHNIQECIIQLLNNKGIAQSYIKLWQKPLVHILEKVKNLNETLTYGVGEVYTEIKGKCSIIIGRREISLCAIADRIEVYPGKIVIADFKTGAPPSFTDVRSSKSPQLMIEAIILVENGFKGINYSNQEVELVFYKVRTNEPYLEEKRCGITIQEILDNKESMQKFLANYYERKLLSLDPSYMPDFWKPDFDDFKHFRR